MRMPSAPTLSSILWEGRVARTDLEAASAGTLMVNVAALLMPYAEPGSLEGLCLRHETQLHIRRPTPLLQQPGPCLRLHAPYTEARGPCHTSLGVATAPRWSDGVELALVLLGGELELGLAHAWGMGPQVRSPAAEAAHCDQPLAWNPQRRPRHLVLARLPAQLPLHLHGMGTGPCTGTGVAADAAAADIAHCTPPP
jgi:hypothetical protein